VCGSLTVGRDNDRQWQFSDVSLHLVNVVPLLSWWNLDKRPVWKNSVRWTQWLSRPAVPPYLEIDNIGLPADHAIYGHKTLFPPSTTCLFGFRQTRLAVVYHGWQNRLSTCGCRSWAVMHVAGDDHSLQCCDHHHSQVNDASTAVGNTSLDFAFSPAVWHLQISWDFEHCLNYFQQMIGADYLCLWLH